MTDTLARCQVEARIASETCGLDLYPRECSGVIFTIESCAAKKWRAPEEGGDSPMPAGTQRPSAYAADGYPVDWEELTNREDARAVCIHLLRRFISAIIQK
jgi:hypothetical protein